MVSTLYIFIFQFFHFKTSLFFTTNLIKFSCILCKICIFLIFYLKKITCLYCCRYRCRCRCSCRSYRILSFIIIIYFLRKFHICNSNISANKLLKIFFMMGIKVLIQDLTCFFLPSFFESFNAINAFSHFHILAAYSVSCFRRNNIELLQKFSFHCIAD